MFNRALGLGVALVVGAVVLVSASGAATTKAQKVTRINVSTRAAVVHYLRSIHVNAKHAVIQRGGLNYAGSRCPGEHWRCTSTKHTVVQIAKQGGQNRFTCRRSHCAVVQISGTEHGVYMTGQTAPASAPTKPVPSTAYCVKTGSGATTGTGQSCVIQQLGGGPNLAGIYQNTMKVSGVTQAAQYTATITQQGSGPDPTGPNAPAALNIACVTQVINLDGSTTNTNGKSTTVNLKAHQSVVINQNVVANGSGNASGTNLANQAANSNGTCASGAVAPATAPGLLQSQILTSSVNATGVITQNLNRNDSTVPDTTSFPCPNVPAIYAPANLCIDIVQNQNSPAASGANAAAFWQENDLTALTNTAAGSTVNQTQGAATKGVGGLWGNVNQQSTTGTSTFKSNQNEVQCEDAFKNQTLPAPTNPALCDTGTPGHPDLDPPAGVTLNQAQYGPAGMGSPKENGSGPVHYYHGGKDPTTSSQTGGNGHNSYQINQNTTQNNDNNTIQKNFLIGGLTSSGDGSVNQNALIQNNPKEDVQIGTGFVQSQIDCSGSTSASCTKTLSTPKITGRSPTSPVFGTDATTFTFSNSDPTAVFSCSLDGVNYSPCNGSVSVQGGKAVGTQTYTASQLASGSHTFYVKTRDADNGSLSPNADSAAWVITPADPSITASSEPGNPALFTDTGSFQFTDADNTAVFRCSLDGAAFTDCTSGGTGASWSGLHSGAHTFRVKAYDSTDTYPSNNYAEYDWVITPPDPTISSGPDLQTTSTDATFTFADADSTAKFECKLDGAASYTPCPSTNPTYSNLSHGPHTLDVKATDSTGAYESTGFAEYDWEVIPYLTFEMTPDGAAAGWSGTPGQSPITLTTGSDYPGTYAQFTIHDTNSLTVDQLQEPTFTTDTFSGGSPRYEIDFADGDYAFGYPSQQGWGTASWDLNCGGGIGCVPMSRVTWNAIQGAETGQTVTDALIDADFPANATYNVTAFQFDGYGPSDVTP